MDERALLRAVAIRADELLAVMPSHIEAGEHAYVLARQKELLGSTLEALRNWDERPRSLSEVEAAYEEESWFQGMIRPKTKLCESCQARIFFAHQDDRWLPLEPHPVEAHSVIPSWRYVVTFVDPPYVEVKPTLTSGPVWVDHRQTCGVRERGPRFKVQPYMKRYVINKTKAELAGEELASRLLALRNRLDNREPQVDS